MLFPWDSVERYATPAIWMLARASLRAAVFAAVARPRASSRAGQEKGPQHAVRVSVAGYIATCSLMAACLFCGLSGRERAERKSRRT
jgi:hypothetical protein